MSALETILREELTKVYSTLSTNAQSRATALEALHTAQVDELNVLKAKHVQQSDDLAAVHATSIDSEIQSLAANISKRVGSNPPPPAPQPTTPGSDIPVVDL